ncbi:MAG: calcineurin-like phosphoesterase family protein [Pirellulales bacterium]|nr:calcineurin-like phosphoesterase family protein [Pirellulales bacterium]
MNRAFLFLTTFATAFIYGFAASGGQAETQPPAAKLAKGRVFHDADGNGKFDEGEKPLAGIRVSNGRDVAATDEAGRYEIPVDDDTIIFVIKPRGWRSPLSKTNLPRFYYLHKPHGSPKSEFPGVAPTGPLPEAIDFPLSPQDEPDKFRAIVFGDTQTRNLRDVQHLAHDVVEELAGTKAAFGITLGDIAFDDLSVWEPQAEAISVLGIPWFAVAGNHDTNYDAKEDIHSDESFERFFGPSCYSFNYGPVHFVVLDDVECSRNEKNEWSYRGNLGEKQLEFLKNDLAGVPEENLVVLAMHIPLIHLDDRAKVYRLIENRPFTLSLSGHTHSNEQHFVEKNGGWNGARPHHHIIHGTACGSWWNGSPDERGIPHATMVDGTPNGYSIIAFDGNQYVQDYKAAGRGKNYQMQIHAPETVPAAEAAQTYILANVFNSSARSTVKMRVDGGAWVEMRRAAVEDPAYRRAYELDQQLKDNPWVDLPKPWRSTHIWSAPLPAALAEGIHLIEVETIDMNGKKFTGCRVFRIVASDKS